MIIIIESNNSTFLESDPITGPAKKLSSSDQLTFPVDKIGLNISIIFEKTEIKSVCKKVDQL